jgi:hypothetical protein
MISLNLWGEVLMKAIIATGLLATLAFAAPAAAAVITWGTPQDISGPGDVSTNLARIEAVNLTPGDLVPGTTVVNHVAFTHDDTLMGLLGGVGLLDGNTTGDAAYDTLIDSLDHGDSGIANPWVIQVGGGNLIVGDQYELQLFYSDNRSFAGSDWAQVYSDAERTPSEVTLNANGGGSLGQYVIGTFTADDTTQSLAITGGGPPGEPHLSAYQIRGVPEPTTFVLGGLGLMSLSFVARRRNCQ